MLCVGCLSGSVDPGVPLHELVPIHMDHVLQPVYCTCTDESEITINIRVGLSALCVCGERCFIGLRSNNQSDQKVRGIGEGIGERGRFEGISLY